MAIKTAKKITKKAVKETTIDFSNSFEKIKGATKTVNNELLNTAVEVMDDLRTNGTQLKETAVKTVKEAINSVKIENGFKFVKTTAMNVNEYSLETAEGMVDGAIKGGKEWQGVAAKAVKGGLELAEKQQEIVFDTLDTLKGQMQVSAKRFGRLFRKN